MSKILQKVKKILLSEPYKKDGYEYQFVAIEGDSYLECLINVILPKKGQSFIVELFGVEIDEYFYTLSKFIGENIPHSEHFLIDGKPIPEDGVYFNEEDCNEIINSLNENIKIVEVKNDTYPKRDTPKVDYMNVGARISFSRQRKFYSMDAHQYIDLHLRYDLFDFKLNGEDVNPNLKMIDEVAEIFNEKLQDSDRFRDKIIDVIYNVLGRNLHINHTEIYYIGNYWINKIDGIKVNSKGNSVKWNFSPDMFIPAS